MTPPPRPSSQQTRQRWWSELLGADDNRCIMRYAEDACAGRAMPLTVRDELLCFAGVRLPFERLAAYCRVHEREQWERLVGGLVDRALGRAAFSLLLLPACRERAEPLLQLRLLTRVELERASELITQELAPGLVAALAIDLGEEQKLVSRFEASCWCREEAALWERGLARLHAALPAALAPVGALLRLEGRAAGGRLLALERLLPEEERQAGALLAAPHDRLLLLLPAARESEAAVAELEQRARQAFAAAEDEGVSPALYRWQEGRVARR